jgi:hypothetical protein
MGIGIAHGSAHGQAIGRFGDRAQFGNIADENHGFEIDQLLGDPQAHVGRPGHDPRADIGPALGQFIGRGGREPARRAATGQRGMAAGRPAVAAAQQVQRARSS